MQFKSTFLQQAYARGFIHQCTDFETLDQLASNNIIVGYNGFDPTATSLHAGHLVPIMLVRLFQKTGHKPIIIVGGGTAKIGDPTGKDEARQLLSKETVEQNTKHILGIFSKYITFGDGPTDAIVLDNSDWLDRINYMDFLRDYGPHFSINRMLTMDSVKLRLERQQPLSFIEFNYMILQAYDFLELNRHYNCVLQLGGSDQWGNIINGVELIRRMENKPAFGLTTPLLTNSDGSKMGKTVNGAVWLDAEKLKPYDFWQFWRNTADADVIRYLKLFTEVDLNEIQKYESMTGADLNQAKILLADEITKLTHEEGVLSEIHSTVQGLFSHQSPSYKISTDDNGQKKIETSLEVLELLISDISEGYSLCHALTQTKLTDSNGEAKRMIKAQAVKMNGKVITDEFAKINCEDINGDNVILLSVGKKKHSLVFIK